MDVEFNLDINDIVAYAHYRFDNSPQIKKRLKIRKLLFIPIGILFILVGLILIPATITTAITTIAFGLFLISYSIFSKYNIRNRITNDLTRRYSEGKNDVIGKHKFSITQDGTCDETQVGKTNIRWNAIESVESTSQYLYITMRGSEGTFIIPRRAFADDGSFNQFAINAKSYQMAANSSVKNR